MSDCPACSIIRFYKMQGDMPIGEQIRQARINRELSQHQLEERIYVNRGYISRVEAGKIAVSVRKLRQISNALGEPIVIGPNQQNEKKGPVNGPRPTLV